MGSNAFSIINIIYLLLQFSLCNTQAVNYHNTNSTTFTRQSLREDPWERTLEELYRRTQDAAGFCFGSKPLHIFQSISSSFPWPLPEEEGGDPVCSNYTKLAFHLCRPKDIELYRLQLLSNDPEKIPGSPTCPSGTSKPACAPGFFASGSEEKPHACCPGYFCPRSLACMMPCPLGAHCPSATPALPPDPFRSPGSSYDDFWCAPDAYRMRSAGGLECGGADRWTIIPEEAFPLVAWDAGSGNLYCEGGWYCPNTTSRVRCPRGYFCRQGSEQPEKCPPGSLCPVGTEVPLSNYGGFAADMLLLGSLSIVWWISAYYRGVMQRITSDERVAISWWPLPSIIAVPAPQRAALASEQSPDDESISQLHAISASNGGVSVVPLYLSSNGERLQETPGDSCNELPWVLDVEFKRLSIQLRSGARRVILSGVSARFRGACLTAILGPSGAGKSTLLTALAGRGQAGSLRLTGEVLVNGRVDRLKRYSQLIGFVPQDDIVHATLTVEENVEFSAQYRLPSCCDFTERRRRVAATLRALGLHELRAEMVGDEAVRGISGGQRKRVNIAVELIAGPRLLLLDEPTSGLDASGSAALVAILLRVAHSEGVTTAAAVHQPRHEAFALFDDLLLLGKGGKTAYYGPTSEAEAYFEGLGFRIPLHTNPADALMDIVAGPAGPEILSSAWERHINGDQGMNIGDSEQEEVERLRSQTQGRRNHECSEEESFLFPLLSDRSASESSVLLGPTSYQVGGPAARARDAVLLAAAALAGWVARLKRTIAARRGPKSLFHAYKSLSSTEEYHAAYTRRPTPAFPLQFWWCLRRAALKRSREPLQAFTDISIVALTGMTLGLLSDRGRATILSYASSVSYSVVALSLLAMVTAVPTYTHDRVIFRREAASGLNRVAYFFALDAFDCAGGCVRAAAYLLTWTSFASPRAVLWQLYLVALMLTYSCSGVSYVLSLWLGPSSAQLAAAVATLVATLVARQGTPGPALAFAQYLTPARWALEGFVIAESNRLTGVWLLARCVDLAALGYDVRRFWVCLVALAVQGLATRAVALWLLMRP